MCAAFLCYIHPVPRLEELRLICMMSYIQVGNLSDPCCGNCNNLWSESAKSPYFCGQYLLPDGKLHRVLTQTPLVHSDFNHLIMDYLVSHGYPLAAHKFATEANMQPIPDVDSITQRVEIRQAIHSGDIQSAVEKINELDPQVRRLDEMIDYNYLGIDALR